MGEAFDRTGHFLGSAEGATKQEVFEKLMKAHGDEAHEIRIRTLKPGPFAEPFAYGSQTNRTAPRASARTTFPVRGQSRADLLPCSSPLRLRPEVQNRMR